MEAGDGSEAGQVLLLGSGEFEPWVGPTELALVQRAGGDRRVLILAAASAPEGEAVFRRWNEMGEAHYRGLGLSAEALPVRTREDAQETRWADSVRGASMVFFSGGNPGHLKRTLEGTPLLKAIFDMVARGGIYAGCSAGAMVAGEGFAGGRGPAAAAFGQGLGLVPGHVFGVHWDSPMMRPWRGLMARQVPESLHFVGIPEQTAVVRCARGWATVGRGVVEHRFRGIREEIRPGGLLPL